MTETVQTLDHGADGLLEGEHLPEPERAISPERALWLRVVAVAWFDGLQASDSWLRNTDRTCDPELVRNESRRWLVLDFGDWKQDREEVCHLAGIDPEMLREAARKKLAEIKRGAEPTAEVVSLDAAFARLLQAEKGMASAEVDSALNALAALELEAA